MRIAKTIDQVRAATAEARAVGKPIVLVPTMGFLHQGHLSLVERGRARVEEGGRDAFVVMSIFVNPTQFGPDEDYEEYPRDLERDSALAEEAGVDVVFAPSTKEMYPKGFGTSLSVPEIAEPMCGTGRPGHFDGVAMIVTKLLNVVAPDYSVFGQKDAQQAILIRRLVADLNLPGEVLVGPTVREHNGLAMSSRNAYLSREEKQSALAISRGLFAAAGAYAAAERSPETLLRLVHDELDREAAVRVEYVELRDRESLREWDGEGPALLAVAARVGKTRLIDNVFLGGQDAPELPSHLVPSVKGKE